MPPRRTLESRATISAALDATDLDRLEALLRARRAATGEGITRSALLREIVCTALDAAAV